MHRTNSQLVAWAGAIGSVVTLSVALGWASPVSVSMIVLLTLAVIVSGVGTGKMAAMVALLLVNFGTAQAQVMTDEQTQAQIAENMQIHGQAVQDFLALPEGERALIEYHSKPFEAIAIEPLATGHSPSAPSESSMMAWVITIIVALLILYTISLAASTGKRQARSLAAMVQGVK